MTTELTPQQQELVAIGASVAAGCVECFDAHLGAARAVGLADDELLAACTSAQAVTAEAAAEWARRLRRAVGRQETAAPPPSSVDSPLAAVGAAVIAGDAATINRHWQLAAGLDLSAAHLQHSVQIATRVQTDAARIRRAQSRAALWGSPGTDASAWDEPCSDACECGRAGGIESDAGERRHAAAFSCCG
jgi:AhpD family alkylhydroperoxidase